MAVANFMVIIKGQTEKELQTDKRDRREEKNEGRHVVKQTETDGQTD